MSDAKQMKDFIKSEMIYDPDKKLEEEIKAKVNESEMSIQLNQEMDIQIEGLKVREVKFEDGGFKMNVGVPPGVFRYTQWWVNRRSRRALLKAKDNKKKYHYYYRSSWERYMNNYWPKQPVEETGSQVVTITYPGE
jgi:predicted nucleotidyltransferase